MGDRKTIQRCLKRAAYHYGQDEQALTKAAEYFALNPKSAGQRERLLYKLAYALFGPAGKKGRPSGTRTSWGGRIVHLGKIYSEKKTKNPKLSDAKIAKLIKSEHDRFKNDDVEQIRQRLRTAHKSYQEWLEYKADEYASEPPEDWEPPEPDDDWDN